MNQPSIQRQLTARVIGFLGAGALAVGTAGYFLTLHEIDEVLDDSLMQTALLLADRDLSGSMVSKESVRSASGMETESMLVTTARTPDGTLLFSSRPETAFRFDPKAGASLQFQNGLRWHVYTVVQSDRVVQVAQPVKVRQEVAVESASQLMLPLTALVVFTGGLLILALRRGLRPLGAVNLALAHRNTGSLEPLSVAGVPSEVLPLVLTLNNLFSRLEAEFEARKVFAASAAHELRSPITALQLQVQVLERSVDPAERVEAMTELSAGIARARRLIEQLLRLSSTAAESDLPLMGPERVSLGTLVREAVIRHSVDAERRSVDLGALVNVEATVSGHREQLEILLNNLVENALRYVGLQGIVDVVADHWQGLPCLRVIDDGPGVTPEDRPHLFQRFYRGRDASARVQMGSGLGLAIVKAIADRHGASVSLNPGRGGAGLEVRVVFPAA